MAEVAALLSAPSSEFDEREAAKAALEASEEQLQTLCASHAGTFVAVERRGRALQSHLKTLVESTQKLSSRMETVQAQLDQPGDEEQSLAVLSERHRVRRRTLLQHSSLLELLELPSLMDACLRSNLYDDALSIASFANTLERRHPDQNKVVHQVISQIRSRQDDLRRHTLHRLQSTVTMPECLEIVTALRRLNSIELERPAEVVNLERVHAGMEMRLQVDFLEARDVWLDAKVAPDPSRVLPVGEPLLDAIERYRTRVFEVATQFNAIFRAQSQPSASSMSLLSMWMARRIRSFLELLKAEVAIVDDSAALRDALEASVFFASSMGRLGADFSSQLPEIFQPKMLSLVTTIWDQGADQLRETLCICRDAGVASPLVSQSLEVNETLEPANYSQEQLANPLPPPRSLLSLPPLARLVNAILTGLNELRRCLLPGIFLQLRQSLDKIVAGVKAELAANERAVLKPGFRGEAAQLRDVAQRFKKMFANTVDPYLRGSLEASLGNKEGAVSMHEIYVESIKVRKDDEPAASNTEPSLPEQGEAESIPQPPAETETMEDAAEDEAVVSPTE